MFGKVRREVTQSIVNWQKLCISDKVASCKLQADNTWNYFDIFVVLKDTEEHGRDLDTVLNTYTELVKPAFEEFCLPVCSNDNM